MYLNWHICLACAWRHFHYCYKIYFFNFFIFIPSKYLYFFYYKFRNFLLSLWNIPKSGMQWNVSIEIYPFRPYVTSSAFLKCWKFQRKYFRCIISHHSKSKKLTSALASCWYALRSSFVLFRFVKLWKNTQKYLA